MQFKLIFQIEAGCLQSLAKIIVYALVGNLFFLGCEVFVVAYSGIPEHLDHFRYLYFGLDGHSPLVPWMWSALGLLTTALVLLIIPAARQNERILAASCAAVFVGTWIDKGLGLITGGFVPTPLHEVVDYIPTIPEALVSLGIYGVGLTIITVLLKIAVAVKKETADLKWTS